MATFYLLRHGETDWNAEGRLQGHSPSNLSAQGRQEALAARTKLPHGFTRWPCYCSDLKRCHDTARLLLEGNTAHIRNDARLREIALGRWEGKLRSEVQNDDATLFRTFKQRPAGFTIDGGESFHDVQNRAVEFLTETAARHRGENVLIVSHRGWIKSALCYYEPRSLDEQWDEPLIGNCSLSILHWHPAKAVTLSRYGDAETWRPPAISHQAERKAQ